MAGTDTIDVLLIGRTGLGKSTLGNILLGLTATGEGSNVFNHNVGDGLTDTTRSKFDSMAGAQSVTKVCTTLYTNISGRILRVTDTPGFADSSERDMQLHNLQTVRQLVRIHNKLRFDVVMYFCPFRGVFERADGYLRKEIELLYFSFGESIFRRMIIVVTNERRQQRYGFSETDVKEIKAVLENALDHATLNEYKMCPPIVYAPLIEGKSDKCMQDYVLEQYQQLQLKTIPPIKIRDDTCIKCGCHFTDRFVVTTRGQWMKIEESKCHPMLLPSSYIAITSVIYEGSRQKVSFTSDRSKGSIEHTFGKNREKCICCRREPCVEGCLQVGSEFIVDKFNVKVFHCSELCYND